MKISRRDMLKLSAGAGAALALGRRSSLANSVIDRFGLSFLIERPIPSSGEMLPIVGVGTARRFSPQTPEERAVLREVLGQLPELGGRLIDTAPSYGDAETTVGDLVAELGNRDHLFLATKVRKEGQAEGVAEIDASFRKLRTDVIDLIQVHNLVDFQTQLATLRDLKAQGRIRYVGMTTSSYRQFEAFEAAMREEELDFVQLNYSLVQRRAEERLLPLAADRGMAVLVNLPYARGRTFEAVGARPLPEWATEFAESWGQFFLKFVVSHPSVTVAIPGTAKMEYLIDNLGAARGPLPDEVTRERMATFFEALS
jgi:aryl-alcohol dehydrogenase-like predicted oxidoreductase